MSPLRDAKLLKVLGNNELHRQERLHPIKAFTGYSGYNQKAIKKFNEGTVFKGVGRVKGIQRVEETSWGPAKTRSCSGGGRSERTEL